MSSKIQDDLIGVASNSRSINTRINRNINTVDMIPSSVADSHPGAQHGAAEAAIIKKHDDQHASKQQPSTGVSIQNDCSPFVISELFTDIFVFKFTKIF